jgi:anti-sigma B factor antagonist
MNAKLTTRQVGDVSIVDVAGRVTAGRGSKALRETLRELTSAGKNKLLVNLCEISYIDSSGIGELVSAFKEITQGGGQLKLVGLSGQAAYQMLITKSCTFFEMYVDEGTAIRSFGQKSAEGD